MKQIILFMTVLMAGPLMAGGYGYLDPVMQLYEEWVATYDVTDYVQTLNDTWVPGPVPKTGQITSYSAGDDGDLQMGVIWPSPRFSDNGDGTVTDNMTGLIWLKDASCGGDMQWQAGVDHCLALADGQCGLTDGSVAGDWRLPNVRELHSISDYQHLAPCISNAAGSGHWTNGDPFTGVVSDIYWSSSSDASDPTNSAWVEHFWGGIVQKGSKTADSRYVWPVRGNPLE